MAEPSWAARRWPTESRNQFKLVHVATALRYRAVDPVSGLIEHEFLHVLRGTYRGEPRPNPDEVGAYRWMAPYRIRRLPERRPDNFTPWFAFLVEQRTFERPLSSDAGPPVCGAAVATGFGG